MRSTIRSTHVLACTCLFVGLSAHAATITVNTFTDEQTANGNCSLREAIINSNADNQSGSADCAAGTGADTIVFAGSGTVVLNNALPPIGDSDPLKIDGGGDVTISGNDAVRVLLVSPNAKLNANNLTISSGGDDPGLPDSGGSGIYNEGWVRLSNCTFSGNVAISFGGGIRNFGTLRIINSTFSRNQSFAEGGAILNEGGGTVIVSTSTFFLNSAFVGGAILNEGGGTLSVTNSTFSTNVVGEVGNGGAIVNRGSATITNSTFSDNHTSPASSGGRGGAILNGSGTLTVTNSTFFRNDAETSGGAIANGAEGKLDATHSTFRENHAPLGNGSGIRNEGFAMLRNTIMGNLVDNCGGAFVDAGFNIDGGTSCGFSGGNNSQFNIQPELDPNGLQDNGGPTKTIAIQSISPAKDAIPSGVNGCGVEFTKDQRGITRPQAMGCDIGSFELEAARPATCNGMTVTNGCNVNGVVGQCVGTSDNDTIRGTANRDVISGGGGNDSIAGDAADDVICGDDGADTLNGNSGNDRLFGGAGADKLNGGSGDDALDGGTERDACDGGLGNDSATSCETTSNVR